MAWSEEKTKRLLKLWPKFSLGEIGHKLHCSRNAVAGKVHRMGLQVSSVEEREKRKNVTLYNRQNPHLKPKRRRKPRKETMTKKRLRPQKVLPPKEAPSGNEVTLLNRKESECAYLVAAQTCCGGPTHKVVRRGELVRTAWCHFHYQIVYQTERKRKVA